MSPAPHCISCETCRSLTRFACALRRLLALAAGRSALSRAGCRPAAVDAARAPQVRRSASARIEPLVTQAIGEKKLPGAVVLVGRGDRMLYQKAFGQRALVPAPEPMTLDTIFDLASLTKVVATTTSVMMLSRRGGSG